MILTGSGTILVLATTLLAAVSRANSYLQPNQFAQNLQQSQQTYQPNQRSPFSHFNNQLLQVMFPAAPQPPQPPVMPNVNFPPPMGLQYSFGAQQPVPAINSYQQSPQANLRPDFPASPAQQLQAPRFTNQQYGQQQQAPRPMTQPQPQQKFAHPNQQYARGNSDEQIDRDFLAGLQIIDTKGQLRELKDFGLDAGQGRTQETLSLQRQLKSIFDAISSDLKDAAFLPLDMSGSRHEAGQPPQTVRESEPMPIAPPATKPQPQSQQVFGYSFSQPKQHQFQYLHPARATPQPPLKSPAQTLREVKQTVPQPQPQYQQERIVVNQERAPQAPVKGSPVQQKQPEPQQQQQKIEEEPIQQERVIPVQQQEVKGVSARPQQYAPPKQAIQQTAQLEPEVIDQAPIRIPTQEVQQVQQQVSSFDDEPRPLKPVEHEPVYHSRNQQQQLAPVKQVRARPQFEEQQRVEPPVEQQRQVAAEEPKFTEQQREPVQLQQQQVEDQERPQVPQTTKQPIRTSGTAKGKSFNGWVPIVQQEQPSQVSERLDQIQPVKGVQQQPVEQFTQNTKEDPSAGFDELPRQPQPVRQQQILDEPQYQQQQQQREADAAPSGVKGGKLRKLKTKINRFTSAAKTKFIPQGPIVQQQEQPLEPIRQEIQQKEEGFQQQEEALAQAVEQQREVFSQPQIQQQQQQQQQQQTADEFGDDNRFSTPVQSTSAPKTTTVFIQPTTTTTTTQRPLVQRQEGVKGRKVRLQLGDKPSIRTPGQQLKAIKQQQQIAVVETKATRVQTPSPPPQAPIKIRKEPRPQAVKQILPAKTKIADETPKFIQQQEQVQQVREEQPVQQIRQEPQQQQQIQQQQVQQQVRDEEFQQAKDEPQPVQQPQQEQFQQVRDEQAKEEPKEQQQTFFEGPQQQQQQQQREEIPQIPQVPQQQEPVREEPQQQQQQLQVTEEANAQQQQLPQQQQQEQVREEPQQLQQQEQVREEPQQQVTATSEDLTAVLTTVANNFRQEQPQQQQQVELQEQKQQELTSTPQQEEQVQVNQDSQQQQQVAQEQVIQTEQPQQQQEQQSSFQVLDEQKKAIVEPQFQTEEPQQAIQPEKQQVSVEPQQQQEEIKSVQQVQSQVEELPAQPIATSTQRPPSRISRPQKTRDGKFSPPLVQGGQLDTSSNWRASSKQPQRSQRVQASTKQQTRNSRLNNWSRQPQPFNTDNYYQNQQTSARSYTSGYPSANQLLDFNPLQFEPERLSSLQNGNSNQQNVAPDYQSSSAAIEQQVDGGSSADSQQSSTATEFSSAAPSATTTVANY